MKVEAPYEILDMESGEEVSLRITDFAEGRATIHPARAPAGVEVDILRVYLAEGTKQVGLPYYDITSKTLRAQLIPYLKAGDYQRKLFTLVKVGSEPSARFSLAIRNWDGISEIRSEIRRMKVG